MNTTVIAAIISILGVGFLGLLGYFLQGLRAEMRDLRADIGELRSEMRAEIGELRSEMRAEIGELRSEISALRSEVHRIDSRLVRVETLLADGLAALAAEPAPA